MIAVIADDFTGAAEIGGIGLKYGLKVIIETKVNEAPGADLLIIATDTRSLNGDEAAKEIERITKELEQLNPSYVYKKLDSVLRGNISKELLAQLETLKKDRAIIVAGNPTFGRVIEHGRYAINKVPLNKTNFVDDPDFHSTSDNVVEIIRQGTESVVSKSVDEILPKKGLIVGDVTCVEDMQKWTQHVDEATVVAGGSGFFDVMLARENRPQKSEIKELREKVSGTLFVFGSMFPKSNGLEKRLRVAGVVKKNMPDQIYLNKDYQGQIFTNWVNEVVESIKANKKTIISIDNQDSKEVGISNRIKATVAKLVHDVVHKAEISNLFIEGGATTSEILRALKIAKLYPFNELDLGVIQMRVDEYPDLVITTKPGSYVWPDDISFENIDNKELIKNG